jgi:hypothetical protein
VSNNIVYSSISCPATVTTQEVILNIKYMCFVSFKDITVLFKEKIEWVAREKTIMKNCAQIYYGNKKQVMLHEFRMMVYIPGGCNPQIAACLSVLPYSDVSVALNRS